MSEMIARPSSVASGSNIKMVRSLLVACKPDVVVRLLNPEVSQSMLDDPKEGKALQHSKSLPSEEGKANH